MNCNVYSHLPAIFSLAHDHSSAGRLSLAQKLAEVFLAPQTVLEPHEESLVNELIEELLKNEEAEIRHVLISRFAEAISAPREVAVKIARAPALIAGPILSSNENFLDEDLVSIIGEKGLDHASAIAARKQISVVVSDALVATGDYRIMRIVAENLGAKLSPKAMKVMEQAARLSSMLQKPILERPELSQESAAHLYWWVTQDLRRATLARFGFGPGKLDEMLKKTIEEKLESSVLQKEDLQTVEHLADWLEEREALNARILPQLLRAGHYQLFNVLLSRLAQTDLSLIEAMTSAPSGKFIVVLCRAIGVEKGNFVSIFLMSKGACSGEQIIQPKELTDSLAAYDRLESETAQAIVKQWKENPQTLLAQIEKS